jgi:hypothetical protein
VEKIRKSKQKDEKMGPKTVSGNKFAKDKGNKILLSVVEKKNKPMKDNNTVIDKNGTLI